MPNHINEITALLKAFNQRVKNPDNGLSSESLALLKAQYTTHPIIKEALTRPGFFAAKKNKSLYNIATELKTNIETSLNKSVHETEHEVSGALTSLLGSVLEGENLHVFTKKSQIETDTAEQALMHSEYWVSPADPESVGLSDTFKSLTKEQKSILEKFSSSELKAQFLNAFPWATGLSNLHKLETAKPNELSDLLGYEHPISLESQLIAMEFILLAFDTMGKLSGHNGSSVLKNYPAINAIVISIEKLQSDLANVEFSQSKTFQEKTKEMVQALYLQNKQLYNRAILKKGGLISSNEAVNNFCHLNEQLMHIMLGQTMERSVLSPSEPSATNKQLIQNSLDKNPYASSLKPKVKLKKSP
tara:strand:+ start:105890 stop:106969 length:1080 start_codon:yes stop_codon:yes gene_type:complete